MRFLLSALMILSLALTACSATKSTSGEELPPLDSGGAPAQAEAPDGTYEDFSDILVPIELTRLNDQSYVYESEQFKTGYLVYEGRVEFNSLVNYFINNMTKDGWTTQSTLRSGNSALVFDKPGKSAMIRVLDGSFKTRVIIIAVESKSALPASSFDSGTVILDSNSDVMEQETSIIE